VLEDGEVFDSSLLKETVNSFLASGKRNVVIDLMQLDYIYSDSINVIMFLNKRITDVGGCLALLCPRPEVVQILQKAGIYNALRVFNSEDEVLRTSEDIISQSSATEAQGGSLSEFDQLRSEIGSVFGEPNSSPQSAQNDFYSLPGQPDPNLNQNFGGNANRVGNKGETPFSPNVPRQPAQRPVSPQGPYTRPGFPNQQPQFQSRQFTPPTPPPATPPRPIMPPPVQTRGFEGVQKPPPARPAYTPDQGRPVPSEYAPETQRFQPAPQSKPTKKPETSVSLSFNEELEEVTSSSKKFQPEIPVGDRAESLDGEEDLLSVELGEKKKSPVLVLSLVAILLLAVVGGVLFGYMNFLKKPETTVQTTAPSQNTVAPAITPAPVAPAAPVVSEPVVENAVTPTKQVEPVQPEPRKTVSERPRVTEKRVTEKPIKRERVVQTRPEPEIEQKPEPAPVQKTAVTVNKIFVNSVPAGATVMINGDQIGKTPLTWDKPVFGPLSIELSKSGFKSTSKDLEFTGGILKESFTLEKDIPLPPPKPEPVVKQTRPEPVIAQQPVKEPEPLLEPEPEPVRAAPAVTSSPVVSSGDASIFIASIPPVADVYLNGKLVGRTNVSEIKLPSGTLTLRFVKGPKEVSQEVTLQPGKNPSRLVRLP
jgi:anti-anti-sigma factor